MGGSGDGIGLFTEEELAAGDRPTPEMPLQSPVPVSGDSDELEFDLLGATSLRPEVFDEPTVVKATVPPLLSAAFPAPAARPAELPPSQSANSWRPPPMSQALPITRSPAPAAPVPDLLAAVPELIVPVAEKKPASTASNVSIPPPDPELDDSFDEVLGFGALSQQNFTIKTEIESDVPWPTGVTADTHGLSIPPAALEGISGFPEPPSSGPLQILYFFAVRSAQRELTLRVHEAEEELRRAEAGRDALLAELAASLRDTLSTNPRFEVLYQDARGYETSAQSKRGRLDATDHELSERLRKADVQIDNARAAVLAQTQRCQAEQRRYEETERAQKRALALASRAQIEMRNVARLARERAAGARHMPPELGERYRAAESQEQQYREQAQAQEGVVRELRQTLEAELDQRRRLEAELGRMLSEREARVMTYEGDTRALLLELDQSEQARLSRLADAGRALLRLRGEVPVDEGLRRVLLGHDETVQAAARKLESLKRALESFDAQAYSGGRKWLSGCAGAVGLILIWLAVR